MTDLTNVNLKVFNPTEYWLRRGWWEVRPPCGFGRGGLARITAPTLFVLRTRVLPELRPGVVYTAIRFGGLRECWRERARLSVIRSTSGRLIMGRLRVVPLPLPLRVQHKGG